LRSHNVAPEEKASEGPPDQTDPNYEQRELGKLIPERFTIHDDKNCGRKTKQRVRNRTVSNSESRRCGQIRFNSLEKRPESESHKSKAAK
jgi:hypothetical protein